MQMESQDIGCFRLSLQEFRLLFGWSDEEVAELTPHAAGLVLDELETLERDRCVYNPVPPVPHTRTNHPRFLSIPNHVCELCVGADEVVLSDVAACIGPRSSPLSVGVTGLLFRCTLLQLLSQRRALIKSQVVLPVNVTRLLAIAKRQFPCSKGSAGTGLVSPDTVVRTVKAMLARLVLVHGTDSVSKQAQANAILLFSVAVRGALASKPVVRQHRLSEAAFSWIVAEVERRFGRARCPAGTLSPVCALWS